MSRISIFINNIKQSIFFNNTKLCSECLIYKEYIEFPKDRTKKFGIASICKLCNNFKSINKYRQNPEKYKLDMRQRYAKNRVRLTEYLRNHPCVDCGNPDFRVLDFDHIEKKEKNVTGIVNSSWDIVLREISKCEVRCANCHRIRHYEEK